MAIGRVTGFDVKTVKKYVHIESFNRSLPEPCKAWVSKSDAYKVQIDGCMERAKRKRKKQRNIATRIFNRLVEEHRGFACSYRLVAAYVTKKKELYGGGSEFYMWLEHIPGEAQVGFGKADFYDCNVRRQGCYLNVSFPHSNAGYLHLLRGGNIQCLVEGLMNVCHIGGVPTRLWLDRASALANRVLRSDNRGLTRESLRLKNHYDFNTAFCSLGKSNEEGNEESKVGYHRWNMLVPVTKVDDLEAFNAHLLKQRRGHVEASLLEQRLHKELFEDERKALLSLPALAFNKSVLKVVHTNSYVKFTLNKGKQTHSAVLRCAKSKVFVKLTVHEIIVLDKTYRVITMHLRLYGNHQQESMD